jgi:hypothetical protein
MGKETFGRQSWHGQETVPQPLDGHDPKGEIDERQ